MTEIRRKVVLELDEKYGDDLLDLEKCIELQRKLLKEKLAIEKEVNLENDDSSIAKVVKKSEKLIEDIKAAILEAQEITKLIDKDLHEVKLIKSIIDKYLDHINTAQCLLQYMKVIQQVENLSIELQTQIGKKDDEKSVTVFANLTEISRNLENFSGKHLYQYLKDCIYFWHNILKDKLAKDLDETLKLIKWPFTSANFSLVVPLPTHIQKLQIIAEYLLEIEIPSEISTPAVQSALLSEFPPLCLPIQLLLESLRKRFIYHFYGTRQTNRVDKPEWYFTQILTWIRDHKDFVEQYIQPVVEKLGLHHIDAKLELMRGLVQIAVEKLNSDIPNIQYDDYTFSHTVDEALGFDKELRETYDYPSNQPSILSVLTQGHVFIKWLNMEKKYATEKTDAMLPPNSLEAFSTLTSDVEDLKVTACADAFITLLQTITARYESLPQPGHRLQFLELQIELLDDFRVRLLQLVTAEMGDIIESKVPAISNTLYYIENVLIDWGATLVSVS
nr:unnamed protein product [Callosobruchus analis]